MNISIDMPKTIKGLTFITLFMMMFLIGMVVQKRIQEIVLVSSMAYGYNEQNKMWNRIRVDEKGKAICSSVQ